MMPLVWCGPEPKDDLEKYVHYKQSVKILDLEIEQLKQEIEKLEDKLRKRKPKRKATDERDSLKSNNTPDLQVDALSLKSCVECLATKRKYPELFSNANHCIYKEGHHKVHQDNICICHQSLRSLLR